MSNAGVQFGILNSFDHNVQTWKTYKGRITQYFIANDINETTDATGKKRKAILLSALTEGTYKLATDLVLPKGLEEVPYEDFLSLLDNHFTPKYVGFGERHNFYAAVQQVGESHSQWAARLRGLTAKCGFLNVEEALRDRFIMGMQSGREKEKLYTKDLADLTLAKVVEMAENLSRARASAAFSAGAQAQSPSEQLFKISGKSGGSVGKVKCSVCGYTNHRAAECRFANYICKKCHVKGHLRKMCTKVNYVEVDGGDKGEDDADDDGKLHYIRSFRGEPMVETVLYLVKDIITSQVYKRHVNQLTLYKGANNDHDNDVQNCNESLPGSPSPPLSPLPPSSPSQSSPPLPPASSSPIHSSAASEGPYLQPELTSPPKLLSCSSTGGRRAELYVPTSSPAKEDESDPHRTLHVEQQAGPSHSNTTAIEKDSSSEDEFQEAETELDAQKEQEDSSIVITSKRSLRKRPIVSYKKYF